MDVLISLGDMPAIPTTAVARADHGLNRADHRSGGGFHLASRLFGARAGTTKNDQRDADRFGLNQLINPLAWVRRFGLGKLVFPVVAMGPASPIAVLWEALTYGRPLVVWMDAWRCGNIPADTIWCETNLLPFRATSIRFRVA
jgi:hypothetical protein